ncbi:nucleoside hydrolase [Sinomonas sp. ASV322]|uniref:nucleoside hydrolase n=1 Tax=Sinomonas sp. ASV322 TaxID=3041920 RepID=UPI0027DB2D43|nr:nucleoside hydrolase [Sinomonas sp. ASV322]MDQ4502509.1 nucleoside hydrolase [Sinomonas sp. ASV322]
MRIVIDCDPGNGVPGANTDDGLALGLAMASPAIDLELVTTVAGNVPATVGASVARGLLAEWGADVPVVAGARTPLVRDPAPWRRILDRSGMSAEHRRLWDGVPRPASPAGHNGGTGDGGTGDGGPGGGGASDGDPLAAAHAIGRLVTANPGAITVVAIGPTTNLAHALRLYPNLARDVAGIAVMGGAMAVPGRPVDTNFGYDPHAAHAVLAAGAPVTVVPLDTTVKTMFTDAELKRLREIGTPITSSLARTTAPWLRYSAETRGIPGCWLHDVLVVAMLVDPAIVTRRPARLAVNLDDGPDQGATIRLPDDESHAGHTVTLVDGVDNARLLEVFFAALEA